MHAGDKKVEAALGIANEMAKYGLCGLEAHFPWEINESNVHLYKQLERETGIVVRVVAGIGGNFTEAQAEFGTASSPVATSRDKYAASTVKGLRLAKDLKAIGVAWPGIDGFLYEAGTDFHDMWDRFDGASAEALDEVPGVRMAIEGKPFEPAKNNVIRHTGDSLLHARDIEARLRNRQNRALIKQGHAIVGLNPEIGHVLMGYECAPYSYSRAMREARLAHSHWNSQPLINYDQDNNPGVVSPDTLENIIFAMRMYGYKGWFGLDINPENMPVEVALANSFNAIERANQVVDNIDHAAALECYYQPTKNRGVLEALMTAARSKGTKTRISVREIRRLSQAHSRRFILQ
jgi:xylose isomerase